MVCIFFSQKKKRLLHQVFHNDGKAALSAAPLYNTDNIRRQTSEYHGKFRTKFLYKPHLVEMGDNTGWKRDVLVRKIKDTPEMNNGRQTTYDESDGSFCKQDVSSPVTAIPGIWFHSTTFRGILHASPVREHHNDDSLRRCIANLRVLHSELSA